MNQSKEGQQPLLIFILIETEVQGGNWKKQ